MVANDNQSFIIIYDIFIIYQTVVSDAYGPKLTPHAQLFIK